MKKLKWFLLVLCLCIPEYGAYARDLVILYDTSGSMQWQPNFAEMIEDINRAVHELVWRGEIVTQKEKWTFSESPERDGILPRGKSMIEPMSQDTILIHPFDIPENCYEPFFIKTRMKSYGNIIDNWEIYNFLPRQIGEFKGKESYIQLAKWSAAYYIAGTSKSKDQPFFLILVSDMREESGGMCSGEPLIAQKIASFDTFYTHQTFYSANYNQPLVEKNNNKANFLALKVSLVTYNERKDIKNDEERIHNPVEHPPEPLPIIDVLEPIQEDLPEPDPEIIANSDPEDIPGPNGDRSAWPVVVLLSTIGLVALGLVLYPQIKKQFKPNND